MNTDPTPAPAEPQSPAEPEQRVFALLDGYWEALRRSEADDPEQWLSRHPECPDRLRDLRVLAALGVARQVLSDDSQPDVPTIDMRLAERVAAGELLEPGTRLGECRIEELLGWGGMGDVYLAEHEVLGRQVAVKVLPARLANDPEAVQRFRKSVQILARLNPHPHIAAALHASTHEDHLYLVMEYVPGTDLKTLVRQSGPLPVDQAYALIRQAAVGLDYAHQQGIVHRDIKPANLMLTSDGTIKILDLGLARLMTPNVADGELSQTDPGAVVGTLDYMAPEQARNARNADARSDLYSLGCTFYYLLTGQPPFEDHSHLEKVVAHATVAPPNIQQLRPEVPSSVAAIVHKLLAKRPEERYSSACTLIETLDAATGAATELCTTSAAPVAAGPAALRPPRSNRKTIIKTWVVVSVLGVALSLMLILVSSRMLSAPDPVRIDGLEARLYRGERTAMPVGTIGARPALAGHVGEGVRVHVQLSRPAYCYLIAYNPNGQEKLCYPGDSATPPDPVKEFVYPAGKWVFRFREEATGLQAFILVASRKPLPPYARWKAGAGDSPWKPVQGDCVWSYDGQNFEPLGSDRGQVEEFPGLPKPFEDLCEFLKNRPGIEGIRGLAFPVRHGPARENP
jgi:hypothetical protein